VLAEETHDHTGKVSFDHIYSQPDPRAFFATLRNHEYGIPARAQPHFERLAGELEAARSLEGGVTLLDVGASYGVNAALLRCTTTLDELYDRYAARSGLTHDELIEQDRAFVRGRSRRSPISRFVGLDIAEPALAYGLAAGYLDDAVAADLEVAELTPSQSAVVGAADLIVSTGCVGYVTEKTLLRVLEAAGERRPWMAHFCLRMFPFDAIAGPLDDLGYETVRVPGLFRQRRFASARERTLVLDRLRDLDLPVDGLEADGWFYAQLHVSTPRNER
jgi:hypothetical protein